jgi:FkbM family methyltransferase
MEEFFLRLCSDIKVSHFIECGAFNAEVSRRFLAKNLGSLATAFEINPLVFNNFFYANQDPRLKYLNLGLSDSVGSASLKVPTRTPGAWSMEASLVDRTIIEPSATINVAVSTIDQSVVLELGQNEIVALWIDVEGNAFKLLQGAHNLLLSGACKTIIVEVQDSEFWRNEKLAHEIVGFLADYGYVPIMSDCPTVSLYNIIFITDELLGSTNQLVQNYWFEVSRLSVPLFPKMRIRFWLSRVKTFLVGLQIPILSQWLIILARTLGSKSENNKISLN